MTSSACDGPEVGVCELNIICICIVFAFKPMIVVKRFTAASFDYLGRRYDIESENESTILPEDCHLENVGAGDISEVQALIAHPELQQQIDQVWVQEQVQLQAARSGDRGRV